MVSEKAYDIERRSMEIIDNEIGDAKKKYDEREWEIVRRVIHATADFDFATNNAMIFHKEAVDSALDAIANHCNIIGDSDIVLAALNKSSIRELDLKCICRISDESIASEAKRLNKTRAEVAMRLSMKEIEGGIVAIGNAPTALYELIRMIDEGIRPALVIGVPVGFISSAESKEALMNVNVPYITNKGRKGGSVVAAATINALFSIYKTHSK